MEVIVIVALLLIGAVLFAVEFAVAPCGNPTVLTMENIRRSGGESVGSGGL